MTDMHPLVRTGAQAAAEQFSHNQPDAGMFVVTYAPDDGYPLVRGATPTEVSTVVAAAVLRAAAARIRTECEHPISAYCHARATDLDRWADEIEAGPR